MRKIVLIISIFTATLLCTTCKKVDLTPAYIVINQEDIVLSLENLELNQFNSPSGLLAHDFSDIWLTANGEKMGIWELPCRVPILESGDVNVIVQAGVKMNGMSTTRPIYPFLESYKTTISVARGEEVRLQPVFKYYGPSLHFPLVENFESAGTTFSNTDTTSPAALNKIYDAELIYHNDARPEEVNTASGMIQLKDSVTSFEIVSNKLALPGAGKYVFLELNYKCDQEIYSGLVVSQSSMIPTHEPLVVMRPTGGKWKKIYINLTLAVSRNITATGFQILFSGVKNNSEVANFYFDNIRVMYLY